MFLLSGDQVAELLPRVKRVCSRPFVSIRKRSEMLTCPVSRSLWNTSFFPSGDKDAKPSPAALFVNRRRSRFH